MGISQRRFGIELGGLIALAHSYAYRYAVYQIELRKMIQYTDTAVAVAVYLKAFSA